MGFNAPDFKVRTTSRRARARGYTSHRTRQATSILRDNFCGEGHETDVGDDPASRHEAPRYHGAYRLPCVNEALSERKPAIRERVCLIWTRAFNLARG